MRRSHGEKREGRIIIPHSCHNLKKKSPELVPLCQRMSGEHVFDTVLVFSWCRRSHLAALLVAVWPEAIKTRAMYPLTRAGHGPPEPESQQNHQLSIEGEGEASFHPAMKGSTH